MLVFPRIFLVLYLLLSPALLGQDTLFHYRISEADAAAVSNGTVPSIGGSEGVTSGSLTLSPDIPSLGVPTEAGDRSIDNVGSAGVITAGTGLLSNAAIISTGGFTFEAWFKWDGGGNVNAIIDYAGTEKLHLNPANGNLIMSFDLDAGSIHQILGTVAAEHWHYVATVFAHDGNPESEGAINGTLSWYLDGTTPLGTAAVTKGPIGDRLDRSIGVAMHPQGFAADYFDGLIYEPRVSLGALASHELLYSAGPRITSFLADVQNIPLGGSTRLSWNVSEADSSEIDHGIGEVAATGSLIVSPAVTTSYSLTASNAGGESHAEVTVFVGEATLDPILSEFMADNGGSLLDQDGESPDWIEVHNPNAFPIALDGWSLSDDPLQTQRWSFPAGTTLAADDYLLVFASGKDRNDPNAELHSNFRLSAAGEYLALVTPNQRLVQEFSPNYPAQYQDKSYGLTDDGATHAYFSQPSPGAANGSGVLGFVADTKFLPDRGFIESSIEVRITSATPGATIIYTTDSSTPTLNNGTRVVAPNPTTPPVALVSISETKSLRAAAFLSGYQETNTDTHSYLRLGDVIRQSPTGQPAGAWPVGPVNGQNLDYGMDPAIVDNPNWGPQLVDALKQIPSISIVTDQEHLTSPTTGIYTHAHSDGDSWERPGSIELLNPDKSPGFQINGGLRIRGGFSRGGFNPKHSFRLFFRSEYGASKLRYPIFGDEGADEFDKIDLRTAQNYAWSNSTSNNELHNTFLRDVFHRDTQRDMGQPYTRSRYYHLYLNGQYWGIYQSQERSESAYGKTYFGGKRDDWDTLKPSGGWVRAIDGNTTAYHNFHALAEAGFNSDASYYGVQGMNPDGSDNPSIERHLDVDNLIDYMITNIYCGNVDGPLTLGGNAPNNFYVIRNRNPAARDTWKFLCHDSEHSMAAANHNLSVDVTGPNSTGSQAAQFNPRWINQELAKNPRYRQAFGDRVQKHFFNRGAMTSPKLLERWNSRAEQMETAIIAESARWGDQHNEPPLDKTTWIAETDWVRNHFFQNRRAIVLDQLRAADLFPSIEAPAFSQHGGNVPSGSAISINAPAGAIYYSMDGSDPRPLGSESRSTLLEAGATAKALIPSAPIDVAWRGGAAFDDNSWLSGTSGVGYETNSGYERFIGLDVLAMRNSNRTVYIRLPFNIDDLGIFDGLALRMRYDDGFVAYLNGVEIARRNAPADPTWDSGTQGALNHEAGTSFEEIDVSTHLGLLKTGSNLLAIHGLNANLSSSDMIIQPELVGIAIESGTGSGIPYSGPITLNAGATLRSATRIGSSWSALTSATFLVDTIPAAAGNLVISEFSYRPGSANALEDPADVLGRSDFEFVELHNVGVSMIDLAGLRFTQGINFLFAPNTTLGAGARILLVRNGAAFEARYGAGLPVHGQFDGGLSNDGETITLIDALGQEIFDFTYNDQAPWPTAADGDGMSLVLIDSTAPLDDPFNWRASVTVHGTPGGSDHSSFDGVVQDDDDHDGLNSLTEYAFGSSDHDPSDARYPIGGTEILDLGDGPEAIFTISYRRSLAADDIAFEVQASSNLHSWQSGPDKPIFVRAIHNGDGTETVTYRSAQTINTQPRQFLRVVISLRDLYE